MCDLRLIYWKNGRHCITRMKTVLDDPQLPKAHIDYSGQSRTLFRLLAVSGIVY